MTLEFIGIAATQQTSTRLEDQNAVDGIAAQSESGIPLGPPVNPTYLATLARAHEDAGVDRVLIAHTSSMPDGFVVADQVLASTDRLKVLLAHRPGFLAPTIAARAFATLDAFHPGRVALHVITGGDDADQARDGDFTDKTTRYRRTDEFLTVLRQTWDAESPFDHEGEFYRVKDAWSAVRPATPIPVYFGGASSDAVRVGGKHADAYAFWGEPLEGIRERIRQVREAAAPHGRDPRFSVSLRPIVADTEQAAWSRAEAILEATRTRWGSTRRTFGLEASNAVGSQRLLQAAAKSDVHDRRLWTALAKVTGATGNSTALVGSHEQVAEALLDYVDLGVTTLLIRGFDPLEDARRYAAVIDLVRAGADNKQHTIAG
jgi:alkanesulfonate monooxygenase